MQTQAGISLAVFRATFSPKLPQATVGDHYDCSGIHIGRLEKGERFPGPDLVKAMEADGITTAQHWYVEVDPDDVVSVAEKVACGKCDRRWSDPVTRQCVATNCPRALFPGEQIESDMAAIDG